MPTLQNSLDIEAVNHKKIASPSDTPPAGYVYIYVDSNGDIFTRDENGTDTQVGSGGAVQLSDLSDVNTSTPTNRNALMGDGVDFESRALVEADISDLDHDAVKLQTRDIAAAAPSDTDYLGWNNGLSQWEPKTIPAASGYPFNVITVDATDADADHATIGAAVTAASPGDTILVGPGTYNETVTVNKAVSIIGVSKEKVIITDAVSGTASGVVTVSAIGATLESIKVVNTVISTTNAVAILLTASGRISLRNVETSLPGSGVTNQWGCYLDGAGGNSVYPDDYVHIFDCYIRSENDWGIGLYNNSKLVMNGGYVDGWDDVSGYCQLHGVMSDEYYTDGSHLYGWFFDAAGDLYSLNKGLYLGPAGAVNYITNIVNGTPDIASPDTGLIVTESDLSDYHGTSQGVSLGTVTNPPTAAELNAEFPNAVAGFVGVVDSAGGGTLGWIVGFDGTYWWEVNASVAT